MFIGVINAAAVLDPGPDIKTGQREYDNRNQRKNTIIVR
jgi:hypothetical protein